ncbi:MAG: NFYB/HAP3 family transcription factor subunit [Candidatus Methanofastidiosia archaeon]|jgi:histone H3/H4
MLLSSPPIERLIRKGGAERVSKTATRKLSAALEEEAIEISRVAIEFAHREGRKTVKPEDIKRAHISLR